MVGTSNTVDIHSSHMEEVGGRRKGGHTEAVGQREELPMEVCRRHRGNVAEVLLRYFRLQVDKRLADYRRDEAGSRDVEGRDASVRGGRSDVALLETKDILGFDYLRMVAFVWIYFGLRWIARKQDN